MQVLYDMAHPSRRREAIAQLLFEPEEVPPECLALLARCAILSCPVQLQTPTR